MSHVRVSTPFNISLDFEMASLPYRILAWFTDLAILLLYSRGMKRFLIWANEGNGEYSVGADILIVSMPMLLYPLIMETLFQGQSIGKKLLKIRVISIEGGEPKLGQYLMRWIFRAWEWPLFFGFFYRNSLYMSGQLFSTLTAGMIVVIIIAISRKSQRLGDLAAGTTVVDLRQRFSLSDTLFMDIADEAYEVRFPEVMRLTDRDINAVRSVIHQARRFQQYDMASRVAVKIKTVLQIETDMDDIFFLEKLIMDYNYIATRENTLYP